MWPRLRFLAAFVLFGAVVTATTFEKKNEIEHFEFVHPEILPEHPDNFRRDKITSRQKYVTKERLPANLEAISYDLVFKTYFPSPGVQYDSAKNFTFDGTATLQVKAVVDSDRFVVNAYNFNIQMYFVENSIGDVVEITSISQDDSKQQLSLFAKDGVTAGQVYFITIVYTGIINPYTEGGVYYTSYNDPQGATHYMIATHMEPFSARKVFPGLDEPSYKALFNISVQYPTSQVALSNTMETAPENIGEGWSEIKFPTTPKMSSYLIAFAVGPYVSASFVNQHQTLTRAWGWPGTEQYLQFAAENAGQCLYQLGEYTGIRFPLLKADQLGMPEFLAGAMENWGLIIYKYQYIAYNPTTMTTRDMEAAAKVMCHELAHQWFGDLVTTAWWDDLFLNEGFADYFMTFIQKSVYPVQTTYLDTLQVLNELQVGLNADVSSDAHPLVYPDGPAFDDITYQKGASMLRMLSDVLGPSVFQQGIQTYLGNLKYSNARDIDLLTTLTEVAASYKIMDWCGNFLNVTDFMQPYLHQTNHPLIRYTNNQKTGGGTFTQEPFLSADYLNASAWNYQWAIPLTTTSLRHADSYRQWLAPDGVVCPNGKTEVKTPKNRAVQWELTSATSATYGRIIYDDVGFDRVLKTIKENDISDNLKLQLLADEYYYMHRERDNLNPYSYDRFLNLCNAIFNTPSFIKTPSYSVFAQAQIGLEEVAMIYRDGIDRELVPRMYKLMFQKVYEKLTWTDVALWDTNTFAEVFLPFAVRYEIGDVRNRTLAMFGNVKSACLLSENGTAWCNPYPTNLRKAIYCGAAQFAPSTSDFFFRMLNAYNQEVVANPYFYQEYMSLLEGMACTQHPVSLKTLIRLFVSSPLNSQTLFGFFKYNRAASDGLLNYFNQNPQVLNSSVLGPYLDAMTYNWNSYTRSQQIGGLMNSFSDLTDNQFDLFTRYLERVNLQWEYRNNFGLKILQWLYDHVVVIGKVPWEKSLLEDVTEPSYRLALTVYIPGTADYNWYQNMTFEGSLLMTFYTTKPITAITINAHRLSFDPTDIILRTTDDDTPIALDYSAITKDFDRGVLTIPTRDSKVLEVGSYMLSFDYNGFIFSEPNEGDYSNTYFGGLDNKKGWIFATDFEGGPGARSLLPCFDEPSYKGTFKISVIYTTEMIALSNALEATTDVYMNGYSITSFEPTEQMSSYLLAICVGHFANTAKVTETGTLVRLWTWAGMEQYGELALNVTVGTLEFMQYYFENNYTPKKLDVMALPEYTQGAGAMENYGLIIGEYSLFMVDPDYTTTQQIAEVAETAAHEVVHQWFGDVVTMDWWNDIFLNEGFAQYWYANGINYTFPEQQEYAVDYNRFYVNHIALKYDCMPGVSKPVISDQPPVFGIEPYYKGSALLNLLSNTLGPDNLKYALVNYLTQFGYDNATPQDLWKLLTDVAVLTDQNDWNGNPLNVSSFMDPYTLQTSYPIITLTLRGTSTVQATQTSCLGGDAQWNIPLSTQDNEGTVFNWFVNSTGGNDATWLRPLPDQWRIDNIGSSSFARINYDDKSWNQIVSLLLNTPTALSATSRAMLIDDARFFYESGRWNMTKFLDLLTYLPSEVKLAPLEQASFFFTELLSRFQYQPGLADVQKFVTFSTSDSLGKFQFDSNGIWDHDRIVQILVELNNMAVNRQARLVTKTLFDDFVRRCKYSQSGTGKCSGIQPDLRASVYCYGLLQSTDPSDFETVDTLYQWSVKNAGYLQTDGDNLLNALGCSQNATLLNGLLDGIMVGDYPASLLTSLAQHDQTALLLFEYLSHNTQKVLFAPFSFATYVKALFLNWSTNVLYSTADNFTFSESYTLLNAAQKETYSEGMSTILENIGWMSNNRDTLLAWIQKNYNQNAV